MWKCEEVKISRITDILKNYINVTIRSLERFLFNSGMQNW